MEEGSKRVTKRRSVLKSKVVDYWMNTDQGVERVKAIIEKIGSAPSFIHLDLDYPECFACSHPIHSKSTRKDREKHWEDVWNRTRLEGAHIVPHSKGGESIPSNIVLLCRDCHRDNPDSLNETFFWKWLCNRPHYSHRRLAALQEIPLSKDQLSNLKKFIDPTNQDELMDLIDQSWRAVDPVQVQGKYSAGSIAEIIHHVADNCKQLKDPSKSGDQLELF